MDIFNKKALEELISENRRLESEKNKLISELATLKTRLEAIVEIKESEPPDCKRGPWCKACEFVKIYHYGEYIPGNGYTTYNNAYMCGKGDSCKHFVQKEINK